MKTLLIASMVFSGGSAVAIQNEGVAETVTETANQVMYQVQKMLKGDRVENIKEEGFPYPSEEYLDTLTEEQVVIITSAIDVINATHDWNNMTDEEIQVALDQIKTELHELYLELGIEGPLVQNQTRTQQGNRHGRGGSSNEDFVPRGDAPNDGTCPMDEVEDSGDTA